MACISTGTDATIFGIYFSNLYVNCTLVELKASNIIGDIRTMTDSPPLPLMNLLGVWHTLVVLS